MTKHYKLKAVPTEVLDDITCNACKVSCKKEMNFEFAEIFAKWGYGSDGLDGEIHRIQFCQSCYERMLELMDIDIKDVIESENNL